MHSTKNLSISFFFFSLALSRRCKRHNHRENKRISNNKQNLNRYKQKNSGDNDNNEREAMKKRTNGEKKMSRQIFRIGYYNTRTAAHSNTFYRLHSLMFVKYFTKAKKKKILNEENVRQCVDLWMCCFSFYFFFFVSLLLPLLKCSQEI